jgi:hypothetical protein
MTGYRTYSECYTNEKESRIVGEDGVMEPINSRVDVDSDTFMAWIRRTEEGGYL